MECTNTIKTFKVLIYSHFAPGYNIFVQGGRETDDHFECCSLVLNCIWCLYISTFTDIMTDGLRIMPLLDVLCFSIRMRLILL